MPHSIPPLVLTFNDVAFRKMMRDARSIMRRFTKRVRIEAKRAERKRDKKV